MHGGCNPTFHGRYSTIKHETLRALIEQHGKDEDPFNIRPEIDAARALFEDFINRYGEMTAAILAWHESYEATRVPLPEEKVMAFEAIVDEWEIVLKEGTSTEPTDRQQKDLKTARAFLAMLRGEGLNASKPRQILDIADAYRIVSEITKIAERVWKRDDAQAVSRPELARILQEYWRAVDARIEDEALKATIRADWLSVRL